MEKVQNNRIESGNHKWKIIFVVLVFGIAGFILREELPAMLQELAHVEKIVVVEVILCGLLFTAAEGCLYTVMAKVHESSFRIRDGIYSAFFGAFYRVVTFGSGTAVAAAYAMSRRKITHGASLSIVTMQFVFQKTVELFLAALMIFANETMMTEIIGTRKGLVVAGFLATVCMCLFLVMLCVSGKFHDVLLRIFSRLDKKQWFSEKIQRLEEIGVSLREETRKLMTSKRVVVSIVLLEGLKLFILYLIPAVILQKEAVSVLDCIGFMASVYMLAGVIPMPGGFGSIDTLIILFFSTLTGTTKALSVMVLYRFATYFCPFFAGIVTILPDRRKTMEMRGERK